MHKFENSKTRKKERQKANRRQKFAALKALKKEDQGFIDRKTIFGYADETGQKALNKYIVEVEKGAAS